jgi:hypothetical protein
MAKIVTGPLTATISGAVGNVVFSRGRYGPYLRNRAIPTLVQNDYTNGVRGRCILLSRAWGALDDDEKTAWRTWAVSNPRIDRVGREMVLQPSAAFISLNARILQGGGTQIDLPPVVDGPVAILGQSLAAEAAGGTCELSWTSGAIDATEVLAIRIAVLDSPGITYYKNRLKLVTITAAAVDTPASIGADIAVRFAPLTENQIVKCEVEVWDLATGHASNRALCETVCTA